MEGGESLILPAPRDYSLRGPERGEGALENVVCARIFASFGFGSSKEREKPRAEEGLSQTKMFIRILKIPLDQFSDLLSSTWEAAVPKAPDREGALG